MIIGDTSDIYLNCALSPSGLKQTAEDNLEKVRQELRILYTSQNGYLLPAMAAYVAYPTERVWLYAKREVARTQEHLDAAIDSAIAYDAGLEGKLGPKLESLHQTLRKRESLLAGLPDDLPDQAFVMAWADKYREALIELEKELETLEEQVKSSGQQSQAASGSGTAASTK
jgi:predicted trehalose synthase